MSMTHQHSDECCRYTRPTIETYLDIPMSAEHMRLYLTNAWFKTAVDTFKEFVPYLFDGMAAKAPANNVQMEEAFNAVRKLYSETFDLDEEQYDEMKRVYRDDEK